MVGEVRWRRELCGGVALIGTVVLALLAGGPSEAAYPGKNGKIVFKRPDPACCEIFTVDLAGNERTLTNNGFSTGDPSWSADGKLITYRARPPGGTGDADIFVMNADGSNERQLTTDDAFEDDEPNFLPDGKTIIFESFRDGDSDIYRLNAADGSSIAPVADTDGGIDEYSPAVSPNGKLIAYTQSDGMENGVWAMNVLGAKRRKVVDTDTFSEFEPNWAPNGRSITFVAGENMVMDDTEIWAAKADGSGAHPVTDNDDEDDTPAFSPDGSKLVWDSGVLSGGIDEIVIMNVLGGPIKALTDSPDESNTPDWGPIPVKCGGKRSTLVGTPGKDKLFGTPDADVIAGLGGGDLLKGKGGKDRLCGGKGRDRLNGGGKLDRCVGGKGPDVAKGCERSRSI